MYTYEYIEDRCMFVLAWMKALILETLLSIYVYTYMKWAHIQNKGHCMCTLASRKAFISEALLSIYVDIYVHTNMRIETLFCLCLPRKKNQRHFPLSICEHIYTFLSLYVNIYIKNQRHFPLSVCEHIYTYRFFSHIEREKCLWKKIRDIFLSLNVKKIYMYIHVHI